MTLVEWLDKKADYKQSDIAKILGVSQPAISASRKRNRPTLAMAVKIYAEFGDVLEPYNRDVLAHLYKIDWGKGYV